MNMEAKCQFQVSLENWFIIKLLKPIDDKRSSITFNEQLDKFIRAKSNYIAHDKDENIVFLAETIPFQYCQMHKEGLSINILTSPFHKTSEFMLDKK